MKKLLLFVSFFVFSVCSVFAEISYDPEKIYLFDVKITVQQNGKIQVTENIILNARHIEIKRGITRDLPNSIKEHADDITLTMDGEKHPFFTETHDGSLFINFGNDDYINKGKHTYALTYSYIGAINFLQDYDELYWNVTGNDHGFQIDKVRVQVIFPENVHVRQNGISLYTGRNGESGENAKQISDLTFQTTTALSEDQGFTISIPFDKGTINKPSLIEYLKNGLSLPVYISLFGFIILIAYCIITWVKIGRDPFLVAVTQYEPPEGISPTFVCYDKGGRGTKLLSCIIISLAMKKYIEIKEDNKVITLTQKRTDIQNLHEEEKIMMEEMFEDAPSHILNRTLDPEISDKLEYVKAKAWRLCSEKIKDYRLPHYGYMFLALPLVFAITFIPFSLDGSRLWIPNIFITIFAFPIMCDPRHWSIALIIPIIIAFIVALCGVPLDSFLCEMLCLAAMLIFAFYIKLIPNITPLGKKFFEYLQGFEKYIKTAEASRFEASTPTDTERIFCDYLPYAFAMGLYNEWIQKFTGIVSEATMTECIECMGGTYTVSNGLEKSLSSSMPVHNYEGRSSSSHSSGSYGGGSSGGGHGGGGIHGR